MSWSQEPRMGDIEDLFMEMDSESEEVSEEETEESEFPSDVEESEEILQFSRMKVFSWRRRIYMEEQLDSIPGANLQHLNLKLEYLEATGFSNLYHQECLEIEANSYFVLRPTVTYPFRLFRLPQLRTFCMKYMLNVKSWKLFEHYVKNKMDLPALMPFLTTGHSLYQERNTMQWKKDLTVDKTDAGSNSETVFEFHTLWSSGIDVIISINDVTLLLIQHSTKWLLLNRLKKSIVEMILVGLAGTRVNHVHLDHVEIDDLNMIPNDSLDRLVLFKVKTKGSITDYLKKCTQLRLFYCMEMNEELVDFATDLHFLSPGGPSLIFIGLGNARITCSTMPKGPIERSFVITLELSDCECDAAFFMAIPHLFPRLKNLKFKGMMSLKLLYQFLLIKSIESIFMWKLEMVPNLVARADPCIREMNVRNVEFVKRRVINRQDVNRTVNVLEESVVKVLPWKNSTGKKCDQACSYDLHAPEDPSITKAMKEFLLKTETGRSQYFPKFHKPICEAFELKLAFNIPSVVKSRLENLNNKELYGLPCSSSEVINSLPHNEELWTSSAIICRNRLFPFALEDNFGWLCPYPDKEIFFELEGMTMHNVDLMDGFVKDTLEYYDELNQLEL